VHRDGGRGRRPHGLAAAAALVAGAVLFEGHVAVRRFLRVLLGLLVGGCWRVRRLVWVRLLLLLLLLHWLRGRCPGIPCRRSRSRSRSPGIGSGSRIGLWLLLLLLLLQRLRLGWRRRSRHRHRKGIKGCRGCRRSPGGRGSHKARVQISA